MLLQKQLRGTLAAVMLVDNILQIIDGRMLKFDGKQTGVVVDALVLVCLLYTSRCV